MNSPAPPTAEDDPLYAMLVAYLDGELGADDARRIERQIEEDETLRGRLDALRDTWNLLDRLPRRHGDQAFTCTTVEMVAMAADDDNRRGRSRRRWGRWLGGVAVTAAAAGAGFLTAAWIADAPNRQLIEDLPLIENVDLYRHVDSVDFLKSLDEEGLFAVEAENDL